MMRMMSVIAAIALVLAGCTPNVTNIDTNSTGQLENVGDVAGKKELAIETENSTRAAEAANTPAIQENQLNKDQTMVNQDNTAVAADQQVAITTNKGMITLKLYPDEAPETVANYLSKIKAGFYEGLTFHRVEDWVIQGGDPLGTGTGGGKMPAEYNQVEFTTGSLGVARGMDRQINNDAQFFICKNDCDFLTGNYTNFGEVVDGMDVVNQIEIGDTITTITLVE